MQTTTRRAKSVKGNVKAKAKGKVAAGKTSVFAIPKVLAGLGIKRNRAGGYSLGRKTITDNQFKALSTWAAPAYKSYLKNQNSNQ